jgi:PilZ domain-containing protein
MGQRPWQIAHVVGKDKRKAVRRPIPVPAMIYGDDGKPIVGCTVRDISATGAQVLLARPTTLPTDFVLALEQYGSSQELHPRLAERDFGGRQLRP